MKKIIRVSTVPTSLESLLTGQLKFLSKHYEVVAVSSPGKDLDIVRKREGVRTVAIPMERRISVLKDFISLFRMIKLFYLEKPYMVHSITPKAGLISMLAGWITGVPVRMHTFTGLVFPTATGRMQKLLIVMDRLICFCATHINPEGKGVKRDLERFHITRKSLHIIANGNVNGINISHFDRTSEVEEEAVKYRETDCFNFCFVGRMVRDKGINELIHVFEKLYEEYPNVRLLLVGSFEKAFDPVLPETEKQILNHPAIRFMDLQKDVRPFLAASDVLVFPSYREGFPNVVLQAGALGLPAIVTDISGCNEIIQQGKNGLIVPPKNEEKLYESMRSFLDYPDQVKEMAVCSRPAIVSRYGQQMVWDALLNMYKSIG